MKLKVTKKEIKESGHKIIKAGFCRLQYLLTYNSAFGYSTRSEGWACDYYMVDNVIISAGYAPIGTAPDDDLIIEHEKKAAKLILDYDLDYEIKKEKVNKLLLDFVKKATKK